MANFKKNDEAVSAVIGVILMVAITVILAAVIAAFVFQLGGNVPKNKQIGVEVKRTLTNGIIQVKTMSGTDVGLLKDGSTAALATYTITMNGKIMSPVIYDQAAGTGTWQLAAATPSQYAANKIGTVVYFGNNSVGGAANIIVPPSADVTVIAHFTDGTDYPAWSGNLA